MACGLPSTSQTVTRALAGSPVIDYFAIVSNGEQQQVHWVGLGELSITTVRDGPQGAPKEEML
jgi:hypothetical protein